MIHSEDLCAGSALTHKHTGSAGTRVTTGSRTGARATLPKLLNTQTRVSLIRVKGLLGNTNI